MYYLNNFLLFSILGHLLESLVYLFLNNNGYSGIMYGPWTPVYGFGIIIIILIYKKIKNIQFKNNYKIFFIFLISCIILTFIEFVGGISIEYFFHKKLWNYENLKFNIGPYIAIEISFIWGICSILYIYILKPITDKITKKIPRYITISILVIFIIDFIITLINKITIF